MTSFYGELKIARRIEAWTLWVLNSRLEIPWLCMRDFNEITKQEEKVRGAIRSHSQMQLFHDIIDECSFMDLGFVGPKFTWSRHFKMVYFCDDICSAVQCGLVLCTRCGLVGFRMIYFSRCHGQFLIYY